MLIFYGALPATVTLKIEQSETNHSEADIMGTEYFIYGSLHLACEHSQSYAWRDNRNRKHDLGFLGPHTAML